MTRAMLNVIIVTDTTRREPAPGDDDDDDYEDDVVEAVNCGWRWCPSFDHQRPSFSGVT